MYTTASTASPSEIALVVATVLAPLALLPLGAAIVAWRKASRGWALVAAGLALLPPVFVLRLAARDPRVLAVAAAFGLAFFAWLATLRLPHARSIALALSVVAALVLVGAFTVA